MRRSRHVSLLCLGLVLFVAATAAIGENSKSTLTNPCAVKAMERVQGRAKVWSPDGRTYLVNEKDKKGNYQIYIGTADGEEEKCISSANNVNGPAVDRDKMQPHWHPSGKWIVLAGEKSKHIGRLLPRGWRQGLVECGVWMDMYATSADGSQWFKLRSMDGFTGVAFTPDGTRLVWAEDVGPVSKSAPFAVWKLKIADFVVKEGVPQLEHISDIALPGKWFEPGNFSPNGHDLLISADVGLADARGQDQFILDINTGKLTNLTNSPHIWDEHGLFSPDGKKIVFMSSYPYRDEPSSYKILSLKTEFMLMNSDGTDLRQLTHFQVPGYPEYAHDGSTAAVAWFNADGTELTALQLLSGKRFPNYDVWKITFSGSCGNCKAR
jgi:Tol biopolymer transport system component